MQEMSLYLDPASMEKSLGTGKEKICLVIIIPFVARTF